MDLDPEFDLSLYRTLRTPRNLVWDCWTIPDHVMQFFVPRPHKVTACDIDVRVGGRFDTTFEVDGSEIVNRGVFLEIVEQEKLVFTDAFSEGWKPAPEPFLTAIIQFEDDAAGGTRCTAIARHRTPQARKSHEEMGFFEGWGTVLKQLEEYAAGLRRPS